MTNYYYYRFENLKCKNIDAASEIDAGWDEKHVIYFTWPNLKRYKQMC